MSRRGNCHDNSVAENLLATTNHRIVKRNIYSSREDTKGEIFNFIEMLYNRKNVFHIQMVYHLLNLRERIILS
jgi:hypothetical protein